VDGKRPTARDTPLVHGLGKDLVPPDWEPIVDGEARAILRQFAVEGTQGATVVAQSPRPQSAGALVEIGGERYFLKRHGVGVRSASQLDVEHAFSQHLRAGGVPVPTVVATKSGSTTLTVDGFTYELFEEISGVDAYRDAPSWSPYRTAAHARAAGRALAAVHVAAASFPAPPRPQGVLLGTIDIIGADDPSAAFGDLVASRPALRDALRTRSADETFAAHLAQPARRAARAMSGLRRRWGHGDWHPSNLGWSSDDGDAVVTAVFDFGLANATTAVFDLAVGIERAGIDWLDLGGGGVISDLGSIDALLEGYEKVRPLSATELAALPVVLPVVHLEYALSEIEYYSAVVGSNANVDLAYSGYLIGHAQWFTTPAGIELTDHLERRALRGHR
jgi:Ser/Thr protein kinase RdoA (MazF antagonist)